MTEYRIDDLAREAGTTVRNVRVYQDRGLMPPPRKQGRLGLYSDDHLTRLTLIGRLLERGYTFATIRELLAASQRGWRVEDMLGLQDAASRPWTDELPGRVTLLELRSMFGKQATKAAIDRAIRLGLLTRHGVSFEVPSPRLLAAGADLVAAGLSLPRVLDLAEALQQDLAVVAERFVGLVAERVLPAEGEPPPTNEQVRSAAAMIEQLRPHAQRTVEAVFASAMEKEVAAALERMAVHLHDSPSAPA